MMTLENVVALIKGGVSDRPNAIDQALWDQALTAAGVEVVDALPEVTPPTSQQIATTVQQTQMTSVNTDDTFANLYMKDSFDSEDLIQSHGMTVDGFLKLKSGAPHFNNDEITKKPVNVTVHFDECKIKFTVKCEINKQVEYYSTYGKGITPNGESFAEKVAYCKRIDPDSKPYQSFDLIFTLNEDLVDEKGKVVAEKGTRVGHSTSSSNGSNIVKFYNSVKLKTGTTSTGDVNAVLDFEKITSKKTSRTWMIMNLKLAD